MVNGKILWLSRQSVSVRFRLMADCADAALGVQHVLIASGINAGRLPFALLRIMRMAKVFGVKVIVATIYRANARRLFAVGVSGVAVAQETLVVHLAQALSLHWLSAAFLGAFRKLDPLPRFNGRELGPAHPLRIVRLAHSARLMRPRASLKLANCRHKKTPFGFGCCILIPKGAL
jgi:hypothetical protein